MVSRRRFTSFWLIFLFKKTEKTSPTTKKPKAKTNRKTAHQIPTKLSFSLQVSQPNTGPTRKRPNGPVSAQTRWRRWRRCKRDREGRRAKGLDSHKRFLLAVLWRHFLYHLYIYIYCIFLGGSYCKCRFYRYISSVEKINLFWWSNVERCWKVV